MGDQERVEKKHRAAKEEREQQEKELEELENRIGRLRVLYDQYFMGIEKMEPLALRSLIEKSMLRSKIPSRGTTGMKFHYRSLQQKFTSYAGYWDRIVRLIEEGRIRRGVAGHIPTPSQASQAMELQESLSSRRRRFVRDRDPGEERGEAQPARSTPDRDEFLPDEVEAIHEALVRRKSEQGEDTSRLTVEVLRNSIQKIQGQAKGRPLTLVIRKTPDGSVQLSARLKKTESEGSTG
jgi:hypothetical protein